MSTETNKRNILVDTSIPLEGGEEVIAKLEKVAPVFVTDIVLQELDGHKNNANSSVAYRAREFFRRMGSSNGISLDVLPLSCMRLEKTDTLRKMFLGSTPLHVLVRKPYKSRDINDSKIIEIAKDYNMTLVTLDTAQRVRGLSDGVNAVTLEAILPQEERSFTQGDAMSEIEHNENVVENKKGYSFIILLFGIVFIALALYFSSSVFGYVFFFVGLGMVSSIINKKRSNAKNKTANITSLNQSNDSFSYGESAISQLQRKIEKENAEKEKMKEPMVTFGWDKPNKGYNPLDLDLKNDILR